MNDLSGKIKRKLIIGNRRFLLRGNPHLKKNDVSIKRVISGENALPSFRSELESFLNGFEPGLRVLVKVNLNSSNPYPASVSLDILEVLIDGLLSKGIKKIFIGDTSGLLHLPTSKTIREKNLLKLKRPGVKIISFDYGPWQKIPIKGIYFKSIILTNKINSFDRLINLSNLKSHGTAGFSAAVKNLVGFMHPFQRYLLHKDNLSKRIAELIMAVTPDLNIIDARKIFIAGGPDEGRTVECDTIIVADDIVEADTTAYNLLINKKREYGIDDLEDDFLDNEFFRHLYRIKDMAP